MRAKESTFSYDHRSDIFHHLLVNFTVFWSIFNCQSTYQSSPTLSDVSSLDIQDFHLHPPFKRHFIIFFANNLWCVSSSTFKTERRRIIFCFFIYTSLLVSGSDTRPNAHGLAGWSPSLNDLDKYTIPVQSSPAAATMWVKLCCPAGSCANGKWRKLSEMIGNFSQQFLWLHTVKEVGL